MQDYVLHLDNPVSVRPDDKKMCSIPGLGRTEWENSSPVGNGFMGASVFGRTDREKIVLNEETVWDESKNRSAPAGFAEKVAHIRELFAQGKSFEAAEWASENLKDDFRRISSFEVAGNLFIDFDNKAPAESYSRDLLLNKGISLVKYTKGGIETTQECFASYNKNVIAIRLCFSLPSSFTLEFEREMTDKITAENACLSALCHTFHGTHSFRAAAKVLSDGQVLEKEKAVRVENAKTAVVYISISTDNRCSDFERDCLSRLDKMLGDYDAIKAEHIADFSSIMQRSDIDFECDKSLEKLTVAQRLERLKNDESADDFSLMSLYWQFGKYLLVSSSRPGSLPANLQGVWGERIDNPWNADYHTNINLQMNYWQAEQANISECTLPLFDYMNRNLLHQGEQAAKDYYGCRGTVTHHLSDIYGFNGPADGMCGLWPMGGAWLAHHMWEHYLYTRDEEFLRNTAYEFIKASVVFFLDYMVEDENGLLLTGPSTSPENSYLSPDGKAVQMCMSPTMDTEIVGGLFRFYLETERLLSIDSDTFQRAEAALKKLPPLKIGRHGQLMEWLEDYNETEPGHRHISHAFALYPGCEITRATPELYRAIGVTLERRLANGGGHTGWSRAWLINLFARLRDGENAYANLKKLFTNSTLDNLFDSHPPFQIDGNFGGAAGIGEMLMQSHEGFISLLPAVCKGLSGSFTRLCARGSTEVSAVFKNGTVTEFTLLSPETKTVTVEFNGQKNTFTLIGGLPLNKRLI